MASAPTPASAASPSVNTLHLWYLGDPKQPVYVGNLNLLISSRGVSLRYAASWLQHGFALSEDLPLTDIEHMPLEKGSGAGAIDDARPDRWGERVIRLIDRPARLSLLEFLLYAGDDRFGALGVSTSSDRYVPHARGPLPVLENVDTVHELVQRVLAGDPIDDRFRRMIAPGASMGGARPKALLDIDGEQWVLKFAETDMSFEPLVEHATMTLAARAGIDVAETRPITLARGAAVAIRRFDRVGDRRVHALSANVALRAAGAELGYPDLAQLLRRRGDTTANRHRAQMAELFRRLVFNILIDNTDDHEKNHVLLMTDAQRYVLSPAFDVLPTGQALGYQAMNVGTDGAVSTLANALSTHTAYGLTRTEANRHIKDVAMVVDGWQAHFLACGVSSATVASYASQIDRPALLDQRRQAIDKG